MLTKVFIVELRYMSASASASVVLGSKECVTTSSLGYLVFQTGFHCVAKPGLEPAFFSPVLKYGDYKQIPVYPVPKDF